ncbi:uncharacterized protein DS421_14g469350 [Arachis hypogaea]|nr:uncharacterized protein DS421_14g469350 [Arachis hypogaea]
MKKKERKERGGELEGGRRRRYEREKRGDDTSGCHCHYRRRRVAAGRVITRGERERGELTRERGSRVAATEKEPGCPHHCQLRRRRHYWSCTKPSSPSSPSMLALVVCGCHLFCFYCHAVVCPSGCRSF